MSVWALVVVAGGLGGLGCREVQKAVQDIARDDPSASSVPAESKPGDGADGPKVVVPPPAVKGAKNEVPAAPDHGVEPSLDEGEQEARPPSSSRRGATSSRGRRRRPATPAGPGVQVNRGDSVDPGDGHGPEGGDSPAPVGAPDLKVTRLVVSRAVSGREPVGVGTSFAAADMERVYAFVELSNEAREASEIVVTFTPPTGGAPQRIRLDIGAERRWRTWALTRKAREPGTWRVAVSDAGGAVLARTTFRITK